MKDAGPRGRILIVDDDEIIRNSLEDMLEFYEYETFSASDGNEALEIYSDYGHAIDLVILDLNMPGLNGHDTYMKLKEMNDAVQVLLATGDIGNRVIDSMRDRGLKHIFQKPLSFETLKNILENL